MRQPAAPVGLGASRWNLTVYSNSDSNSDKDDEVAADDRLGEAHADDVDEDVARSKDGRRSGSQGQHSFYASASSTTEASATEEQQWRPRKRKRSDYMNTMYKAKQDVISQRAWCGSTKWPWLAYNKDCGFHCFVCINAPNHMRKKDILSTTGYGVDKPISAVNKLSEHLKGGQHAVCQERDELMKSQPKVRCHTAFASCPPWLHSIQHSHSWPD